MKKCPYRFHLAEKKQDCIEHQCELFTQLLGKDPQTGVPKSEWGCSLKWIPILLVDNSSITRTVAAAIDRNNNVLFSALPEEAQLRVMSANSNLLKNGTDVH